MRVSRIYLPLALSPRDVGSERGIQDNDRIHYLKNVLRLKPNDPIVVFNNEGGEYNCEIIQLDKRGLRLLVHRHVEIDRALPTDVSIGLCVTKKDAMDTAIQKVTELGVSTIVPLISNRVSVATKQIEGRRQHWQNVAISACEQCGLNQIPKISAVSEISAWLQTQSGSKFVADIEGPSFDLPVARLTEHITLLVGPEGGLTLNEIELARHYEFVPINLGDRILRAETAAISLMTLVNQSLSKTTP